MAELISTGTSEKWNSRKGDPTSHGDTAARGQLKSVRGGGIYYRYTDAAYKASGTPPEYFGETLCEHLRRKKIYYSRVSMWGVDCYVHQRQQQSSAGAEFNSYGRKGILAGYNDLSPSSHGWVTQEETLGNILHVTFDQEDTTLDLVGETKAPDLS